MTTSSPAQAPEANKPDDAAAPEKPGVLLPWVMVVVVLVALFSVHFVVMDPLSEAIQQVDALKDLTTSVLPSGLSEITGEFLSWFISLGVQTPYGPLASLLGVGLFTYMVIVRFFSSFIGAAFSHLLLFLTGGTKGGWRVTFRVFALNRAWVEFITLVLIIATAYSPIVLPWKLFVLLIGLLTIRLLGMATLLAQIVRDQDLGSFRTFAIAAPFFAVFTVLSMVLSLGSWIWVGLWCVAKAG